MADETPDYWPGDWFSKESTRAQGMKDNPQAMIPAIPKWGQHTQSTARDVLLSALLGSGEGSRAASEAAQYGDPLAAVIAGITGSARGVAQNSPQQIAKARALQAQKVQMEQLESLPVGLVSKKLVEEFGLDPETPLGLVHKLAPLLQRQQGLEQQLAMFMAAEKGRNDRAEQKSSDKDSAKTKQQEQAFQLYETARDGLMAGLSGANTGPLVGKIPAFTSEQQIAEGAVAAMAPVLKQLFRVAGEGTFTDKDQELLLNMIPTRKTEPAARKVQIENIDAIVKAKLGVSSRQAAAKTSSAGKVQMVSPGGKLGWIPEAQAAAAEAKGFRRIR